MDKKYEVYVSYEVNGTSYESRLNGYSFNYHEGQKIKIYYDKNDPSSIGSKSLKFLSSVIVIGKYSLNFFIFDFKSL